MMQLFRYLKGREWQLIGVSFVFIIVQVWLDLKLPDYMSAITTLVLSPGHAVSAVWQAGGRMLLCALGSLCASVLIALCAARIGSRFAARLRAAEFRNVLRFSPQEINRFSTASLITRATNDVTQVQMLLVMGLQVILKAPILAAWAIIKISGKNARWTFSTGVAVAVLLLIVGVCMTLALPKFKKIQALTDDLNRVTRENLTGLPVVHAYNAEAYQEAKFETANGALTRTHLYAGRVMAIMSPGISLVMSGLTLSIYWIGATLINAAAVPDRIGLFSDMVVFSSYAMQVVMAFMMLVMVVILLPRASVAARRIAEVLTTESSILDGPRVDVPGTHVGEVEFDHVSFRYPDAEEYVLQDITFTARRGETVAFIGSTGCGKSTLINLIPRFYDATEGEVRVDGVNVKEYTQAALRNKLGYVTQRATLFGGKIATNIAYGDNGRPAADRNAVIEAAYTAQAADFIEAMDNGYDGFVAQGGTNLSGGQKQRISIARAICRNPEILIFDDSFSALDYKTSRALRSALARSNAGTTRLIVAQRIGTILDADRIIVLEHGRVVGNGTHRELMQTCAVYQEIAASQFAKEDGING